MATLTLELPDQALRTAEESAARWGMALPELIHEAIAYYAEAKDAGAPARLDQFEPNAETLEAMADARAGRVTVASDLDDLFRKLNADS